MTKVPALHMTWEEAITLMLLAGVGATAFDMPTGLAQAKRKMFEDKFGIQIRDEDIANIIHKIASLTKGSGAEDVEIDG